MGRMVTVDEWAEIHGKTHATVMRKIYAHAWPQAQKVYQNGKPVWMMDEDWLWPRAMTPTRQAKLLCEIRHLMPPVIYATTADGVVICMVTCTKHTHIACGVTADEMNDLWKAPRRHVRPHRQPCNMVGCTRWLIRDPTTRKESVCRMSTTAKVTRKAPPAESPSRARRSARRRRRYSFPCLPPNPVRQPRRRCKWSFASAVQMPCASGYCLTPLPSGA